MILFVTHLKIENIQLQTVFFPLYTFNCTFCFPTDRPYAVYRTVQGESEKIRERTEKGHNGNGVHRGEVADEMGGDGHRAVCMKTTKKYI